MEFDLTAKELGQIELFIEELAKWNKRIKLTSVPKNQAFSKLVEPSLMVSDELPSDANKNILDLGAGAGIPGVPLAIRNPNLVFTLIDGVEKKISFIKHITRKLGLENVTAIPSRAETLCKNLSHKEKYDVVVSRAVCELERLISLSFPFLKPGGLMIAIKGSGAPQEIEKARKRINAMSGELVSARRLDSIGDAAALTIVKIRRCST